MNLESGLPDVESLSCAQGEPARDKRDGNEGSGSLFEQMSVIILEFGDQERG
ncbi:hypothetical protein [Pelagibius sp. Alg239-R121]|uniref:hypothetical protein n=1 Tax=Pelagibius sp. Alg239-R121 TaxID=2993448 RepID=UPI0024A73A50|nr:hypothetical protein [Pelagibius sp. Alg239-R121]